MISSIKNPILKGFNPDPSILRVGDDYYIATSTFEWFPGVQIHHSKDLVNWQLITRPLRRKSQLDMIGAPDSCGVWAPCLSYDKGTFYLVYSNVKSFAGTWKDTPNFVVTTDDILGDWSDPIFLNSSGFDGSMFHDDDGRKWYLSMLVDHRKSKFFGGIIMQEYDPVQKKLIGESHYIHEGTELGCTEGPHLYIKDGYYYLVLAEGGTEYNHAVTVLRSKEITGPYELHPDNPFVTAAHNPELPLQKSGHGDFVQTQNGDWYAVFLVGRPIVERGRCILGRETAIQKFDWSEGEWPRLSHGNNQPQLETEAPDLPAYLFDASDEKSKFEGDELDINFQSLRVPTEESWCSLTKRKGYLTLSGRDSLSSFHRQSMIARRVQDFHTVTTVCMEFDPINFQQMAGLVCYYNTSHFYYLHVHGDERTQTKWINIVSNDKFVITEPLENPIEITGTEQILLRSEINCGDLQFYYSLDNQSWKAIGPVLDASILSDDYIQHDKERYMPAFTGSFLGMTAQDLTGKNHPAYFKWFEYKEI
ncbi:MAG: glycoside hydrolase family 43 protein [Reichenbachiella sp.]